MKKEVKKKDRKLERKNNEDKRKELKERTIVRGLKTLQLKKERKKERSQGKKEPHLSIMVLV